MEEHGKGVPLVRLSIRFYSSVFLPLEEFSYVKIRSVLDVKDFLTAYLGGKNRELADCGNQFSGNCYLLNLPHLSHEKCEWPLNCSCEHLASTFTSSAHIASVGVTNQPEWSMLISHCHFLYFISSEACNGKFQSPLRGIS